MSKKDIYLFIQTFDLIESNKLTLNEILMNKNNQCNVFNAPWIEQKSV